MVAIKVSSETFALAVGNPYGYGWNGLKLTETDNAGLSLKLTYPNASVNLSVFFGYSQIANIPVKIEKLDGSTAVITGKKDKSIIINLETERPDENDEKFNSYVEDIKNASEGELKNMVDENAESMIFYKSPDNEYLGVMFDLTGFGPAVWIDTYLNRLYFRWDTYKNDYQIDGEIIEIIDDYVIENYL